MSNHKTPTRRARTADETVMSRIVGQNVKRGREARRMTVVKLAEALRDKGYPLSRFGISQIESGTNPKGTPRAVTVDDLVALAAVLGVQPSALLEGPKCRSCFDVPPAGFACRTCGAES